MESEESMDSPDSVNSADQADCSFDYSKCFGSYCGFHTLNSETTLVQIVPYLKIKRWTAQEDPPEQRYMARLTGVSQPTVSRIVNEDLNRVCLKKPTAPKLTDAQVAQRKVRAKPFSLLVSSRRESSVILRALARFHHNAIFLNCA